MTVHSNQKCLECIDRGSACAGLILFKERWLFWFNAWYDMRTWYAQPPKLAVWAADGVLADISYKTLTVKQNRNTQL